MAGLSRGRRNRQETGFYWPGFVDAMAQLLLVITFLVFFVMPRLFGEKRDA